ncbi:hypothetical protein PC123_g7389 [Phytophthora cactorum]|nr:hypothetical protein PC123_g7389 [Phytophthora cactorum]
MCQPLLLEDEVFVVLPTVPVEDEDPSVSAAVTVPAAVEEPEEAVVAESVDSLDTIMAASPLRMGNLAGTTKSSASTITPIEVGEPSASAKEPSASIRDPSVGTNALGDDPDGLSVRTTEFGARSDSSVGEPTQIRVVSLPFESW